MKPRILAAIVAVPACVSLARAQSLPPGEYAVQGTVTSMSGSSCPLAAKSPATGLLFYPGIGRDTTQLLLESVVPQQSVTVAYMNAFPAVPSGGLNGWSASNPVSANYTQYRNGTLTGGGTAAVLSFDLVQSVGDAAGLSFAQGTLSISVDSIAPCKQTVQMLLLRVGSARQPPGGQ